MGVGLGRLRSAGESRGSKKSDGRICLRSSRRRKNPAGDKEEEGKEGKQKGMRHGGAVLAFNPARHPRAKSPSTLTLRLILYHVGQTRYNVYMQI